jgi:hypothetical protein
MHPMRVSSADSSNTSNLMRVDDTCKTSKCNVAKAKHKMTFLSKFLLPSFKR